MGHDLRAQLVLDAASSSRGASARRKRAGGREKARYHHASYRGELGADARWRDGGFDSAGLGTGAALGWGVAPVLAERLGA